MTDTNILLQEEKDAKEDPRFLEVWLKYASMAINPLNIYEYMYNNGMCTQQAGLYDAWAWHLETQNKFKAAESVYVKVIMGQKMTHEGLRKEASVLLTEKEAACDVTVK